MSGTAVKARTTQSATPIQASRSADDGTNSFAKSLDAIEAHYNGGARTLFPLPLSLSIVANSAKAAMASNSPSGTVTTLAGRAVQTAGIDRGALRIDAITRNYAAAMNTLLQTQNADLNAAVANLEMTGNTSAFNSEVDQAGEKSIQEFARITHENNEQLKSAGHDFPDKQGDILNRANASHGFFHTMMDKALKALKDIYNAVMQWIASAVDWAVKAVQAAREWLENAVSDVEHWVEDLF